ncbi:MAG: Eco57I restriction-modification methylase domain-containing protein [Candidatus Latescibacteria bacterium]|nr:Eco57I restriction-modification methylase domain-containing protein [Candidatus Latescibacterota bacterium]
MLVEVEQSRVSISKAVDTKRKSQLGQFFTPAEIARFMVGMFGRSEYKSCRVLDAGAGIGSLSAAFLDKWVSGDFNFQRVELDAFEIDQALSPYLTQTFEKYRKYRNLTASVRNGDFIHIAADWLSGNLFADILPKYTHAILNPPYKKIRSDSAHRKVLRQAGIETVNLYSAFVALSLSLLDVNGQLVAIIPRSFCNGPYYRPFRKFILERAAIQHIHLFESRNKAFKDDDVLQENIIIRLERGSQQGTVVISTSTDDSFSDLTIQKHPFNRIVFPDDPERFIHVPTSLEMNILELCPSIHYSLTDLKVNVSTGPVVDFRLKEHLREMPEAETVPLLYSNHLGSNGIEWPNIDKKKPNAIKRNHDTEKWLYPNGYYCVVRRFSSKEEKRRVMASVIDPSTFADAPVLGFENHLNVFHENRHGLPQALAFGLFVFLNTTAVDEHFRRFNGHTQVNATDLKQMKYPSRDTLITLGKWAMEQVELSQVKIDMKLETLIS